MPGRAHAARSRQFGACSTAPTEETPPGAVTGLARVRRPCGDKAPPFPGSCLPPPLHARRAQCLAPAGALDARRTESPALAPGQVVLLRLGFNVAL